MKRVIKQNKYGFYYTEVIYEDELDKILEAQVLLLEALKTFHSKRNIQYQNAEIWKSHIK